MTKRAILILSLAVFAVSGMFAQELVQEQERAEEPRRPRFSLDRVVANVGNSVILYSDVVETERQIIESYRRAGYTPPTNSFYTAFEQLLELKLGYNQGQIDSVAVNMADMHGVVQEELDARIAQEGSIRALETKYNMPIFEIRELIRRSQEEMEYYRAMRHAVTGKVAITPGEVEAYFRSFPTDSIPIIPDQYMYAHITRYPPAMIEVRQRLRERMMEMRADLIAGTSRFEVLAALYSDDTESAARGGEFPRAVARNEMEEPFGTAMVKLRPGQVSEVVETERGYHLIEVMEVVGDRYRVRHILMSPRFTTDEIAPALQKVDSLVAEIRGNSITFAEAAMRYSDDVATRMNGGLVNNMEILRLHMGWQASSRLAGMASFRFRADEFEGPLYRDFQRLRDMQPGDVSDAFSSFDFRGNTLAKTVKLLEFIPAHEANLAEDYLVIENEALERKMQEIYNRWLRRTIQSTFIRIDPALRDGLDPKWVK